MNQNPQWPKIELNPSISKYITVDKLLSVVRLVLGYIQYSAFVWVIIFLIPPCAIIFVEGVTSGQGVLNFLISFLVRHAAHFFPIPEAGHVSLGLADIIRIISIFTMILFIASTVFSFILEKVFRLIIDITTRQKAFFLISFIHLVYFGSAVVLVSRSAKIVDVLWVLGMFYVLTMCVTAFYLFMDFILYRFPDHYVSSNEVIVE